MRPIRVVNISQDWYPFDTLVRRIAEAGIDGGCEVDVICAHRPGERWVETWNGVRIYRLPDRRITSRALPLVVLQWCWFLVLASVAVSWLHLRRHYDVIHVHNMPDFLVFSALVPKLLGAKVILEVQDPTPELMTVKAQGRKRRVLRALAEAQERISTAFADHVITVGWTCEQVLVRRGVAQRRLTSILNSADPALFPAARRRLPRISLPSAEEPLVVIYHGTLAERNGLDTAIRALALALPAVPHLRLDILGRGEEEVRLKQLAVTLGVSERIQFIASPPSKDNAQRVLDFVTHGDIGIIPYRSNAFMDLVLPTKAYEFAWLGVPMIAANTPGIRSMFRPVSLVLCPPAHAESFAEAIVDLYWHPEKRLRMAQNAAEDYLPFRWELMKQRYQELLVRLARPETEQRIEAQAAMQ